MTDHSASEKKLTDMLFGRRDLALISSMGSGRVTDIEALTAGLDPDNESLIYMLSLSLLGYRTGFEGFPENAVPRLQGLHRYYQVRNGAGMPWFRNQLNRLGKAGIPVMLTGDTAIRAYYSPDNPRMFSQYGLTVVSEKYAEALELLRNAVKNADKDSNFDRTMQDITVIKLFEGVPDKRFTIERSLWTRASKFEYLGHEVYVPSKEDMLIYLLCVPYGPWALEEDINLRTRRVTDACAILMAGKDFDYGYLANVASMSGAYDTVRYYLSLINVCVPGMIPDEVWSEHFAADGSFEEYLNLMTVFCNVRKDGPAPGGRITSKSPSALLKKAQIKSAREKVLRFMEKSREVHG